MSKKPEIALNLEEASNYLSKVIVNNYRLEKDTSRKAISYSLVGNAGLGKTSIVRQLEKNGIKVTVKDENGNAKVVTKSVKVVYVNAGQIEEIGDIVGFPVTEFKVKEKDGTVRWVPESQMHMYESMYESRMSYAIPSWLEEGMTSNSDFKVLFIDDILRSQPQILQGIMQIIDQKEHVSWKLGPEWTVILSENPENENYTQNSFDAAGNSRYIKWNIKYDNEIWCNWALNAGVDQRAVNFVFNNGKDIIGKNDQLNSRLLTKFFDSIKYIPDFNSPEGRAFIMFNAQSIIPGEDGMMFANLFMSFIDQQLDKLPTPEKILGYKKPEDSIKLIKDTVGSGDKYRSDIASILMFRIANYLLTSDKLALEQIKNSAAILMSKEIKEDLTMGICYRITAQKQTAKGSSIISRLFQAESKLIDKLTN